MIILGTGPLFFAELSTPLPRHLSAASIDSADRMLTVHLRGDDVGHLVVMGGVFEMTIGWFLGFVW